MLWSGVSRRVAKTTGGLLGATRATQGHHLWTPPPRPSPSHHQPTPPGPRLTHWVGVGLSLTRTTRSSHEPILFRPALLHAPPRTPAWMSVDVSLSILLRYTPPSNENSLRLYGVMSLWCRRLVGRQEMAALFCGWPTVMGAYPNVLCHVA